LKYTGNPYSYLARAAGVKLAELLRLWPIVIGGVLLNVAELKQLDVLVHGDLSKWVGPDHSENICIGIV
jgi:hypothetical protein